MEKGQVLSAGTDLLNCMGTFGVGVVFFRFLEISKRQIYLRGSKLTISALLGKGIYKLYWINHLLFLTWSDSHTLEFERRAQRRDCWHKHLSLKDTFQQSYSFFAEPLLLSGTWLSIRPILLSNLREGSKQGVLL